MIGRVYLDSRPDLRSGADGHRNDVKNDAVEVEEHVRPDPDVVAEIGYCPYLTLSVLN